MRHLAPLACLLVWLTAGCAVEQVPVDGESDDDDSGALGDTRRVLLCQQGLSDRTMEWDKGLFDLCEAAEASGFDLIWDGDYPAFGALDENGAYKALFDALDENNDGFVDGADSPALVHLVGFSWGGINVTDLAKRLGKDSRIATGRRGVSGMVLLDAYQPQAWHATIPANVASAWVYRQTDTTSGDCSSTVSLGFGFNGKSPVAKSEQTSCTDYDLDAFLDGVGHCDVPKTATDAALVNLIEHKDYEPWAGHAAACDVD
jgi:pimeloyl-ACP methyl ester carboxylesterase